MLMLAIAPMAHTANLLFKSNFGPGVSLSAPTVAPTALSVPAPAIQLGPQGPYLFVVKDGVAELRNVVVKRTQNGESVIGNEARAQNLFKQEYISRQDFDVSTQAKKSAQAQL
ncbi:MAG: hypothetical protein EBU46_16405, partial [Nitrosomonadaceae bacterium]|nr:hypothetical protein [Nitrosomonadaceae bacterium]